MINEITAKANRNEIVHEYIEKILDYSKNMGIERNKICAKMDVMF